MKQLRKPLALSLAILLLCASAVPVARAETLPVIYDEAYYATLDYYGAPLQASVVKSYRLNGASTVTDYGRYDQVLNLTDSGSPTVAGDRVTFTVEDQGVDKFYFEGRTQAPFQALPWNITVSYKLNGAPALAEDLAGQTGLVEICLDVTPDPNAPAYSRDNLVLTAAAAFNDDHITSLEAPGAEVQLVGNLRTVLFAVLPGEEQHFVIRVGSNDFSFSGLVLLAVPATLQQLEQVADLREAKEKGEESLDDIDRSMDAFLRSLEGMSGSLNAAAGGLDQLNTARGTVSAGKGGVYDKTDQALSDLTALSQALGNLDQYAEASSLATTDLAAALNEVNAAVQDLKPHLSDARSTVAAIQSDTKALQGLLDDVESYNTKATDIATHLAGETQYLDEDLYQLRRDLERLASALNGFRGITMLSENDLLAMLPSDQAAQMRSVLQLHQSYEKYLADNELNEAALSFQAFIIAGVRQEAYATAHQQAYQQYRQGAIAQGVPEAALPSFEAFLALRDSDPTIAAILAQAEAMADAQVDTQAPAQAKAADEAYQQFSAKLPMVSTVNKKIREVNIAVTSITGPTGQLMDQLAFLCQLLGDNGAAEDARDLAALCRDLLSTLDKHKGEGSALLSDANQAGDLLARITKTGDDLLKHTDSLVAVLNEYEPQLQSALTDVKALSVTLQTTLTDTAAALETAEGLLKAAGSQLDGGTQSTLSGVAAALRKATVGLDEIHSLREAKDSLTDLIEDEWDQHTGGVDGLLNMDAGATPVSMTDPRNPAPRSVQYVMRTQEIKVEEEAAQETAQPQPEKTTFWQRVAALFQGLWQDLKKLLHLA